jgi:lipid-A-disaccharide synthase
MSEGGPILRRPLKLFLVAGETSGDHLGGKLMRAVLMTRRDAKFAGVGGPMMASEGLKSLFPMDDIAVMGVLPVIRRLPSLLKRISETAEACVAEKPDALVIIDSPDFTHRVARKVRAAAPSIPIIDYVSPSVWAWRPGRAKAMRSYVDHVLALLPFEPAAFERLGGPPCSYVGHPLIERLGDFRPSLAEAGARETGREILLLPGSRHSEVTRLLPVFGAAATRIATQEPSAIFSLPVAPHVSAVVRELTKPWPVRPRLLFGEGPKLAAFKRARAALAASGTVTLELALAQIPMAAAYKVSWAEAEIARRLLKVHSVLLPNLILGDKSVPELLQSDATPEKLAAAMLPLIRGGAEREAQIKAFKRVEELMSPDFRSPSRVAAEIVLKHAEGGAVDA